MFNMCTVHRVATLIHCSSKIVKRILTNSTGASLNLTFTPAVVSNDNLVTRLMFTHVNTVSAKLLHHSRINTELLKYFNCIRIWPAQQSLNPTNYFGSGKKSVSVSVNKNDHNGLFRVGVRVNIRVRLCSSRCRPPYSSLSHKGSAQGE